MKIELVDFILSKEWIMFQTVENAGGRADCQDDYKTFHIMRKSQFMTWDTATLSSYKNDLISASKSNRNLISEKYAYMMENTYLSEYQKIACLLPEISNKKMELINKIMEIHLQETYVFNREYPEISRGMRPVKTEDDEKDTSMETYLKSELKTYSEKTLSCYINHLSEMKKNRQSIVYLIFENTAKEYGFESIEDFVKALK